MIPGMIQLSTYRSLMESLTRNRLYLFLFLVFPLVFLSYWWWGCQASWNPEEIGSFMNSIFHTSDTRNGPRSMTSGTRNGPLNMTSGTRNTTILLWYWPFGETDILDGDVCWDLYHIPNCRLVDQRSLFRKADLVVFHNRELVEGKESLPLYLRRPRGQRWVWFSLESPENNGNMTPLANRFNLAMSYRRDADIYTPYGKILLKQPGNEEHGGDRGADDNAEGVVRQIKTHLICWVVSNYNPFHRRTQVYQELISVVPVEVYGGWRGRPLSSEDLLPTISRCYFYLAFENSISKDYITEKLWHNAYQSGAVPVVLGGSLDDYKAVAPPHSFLHVDEFASVKDLGNHLIDLAEDQESYAGYLAWRDSWKVKTLNWKEMWCGTCSKYDSLPRKKVYTDLDKWVWD